MANNVPSNFSQVDTTPVDVPVDLSHKTIAELFGQIVWLMTQDQTERQYPLSILENTVMPALMHKQFKIYYATPNSAIEIDVSSNTSNGLDNPNKPLRPIGFALWAFVSDQRYQELIADFNNNNLLPTEWNSGSIRYIVKVVAPFGARQEMLDDISKLTSL